MHCRRCGPSAPQATPGCTACGRGAPGAPPARPLWAVGTLADPPACMHVQLSDSLPKIRAVRVRAYSHVSMYLCGASLMIPK